MRIRALSIALAVLAASCSQHIGKPAAPGPPRVGSRYTVTRDVTVSPADWPQALLADVYRPEGAGPFPSVLLIHGGAWKRGGRPQVEGLAKRIAARGYLVVNTTYRLVPEFIFPAQLEDVQEVLRWMRTTGSRYGVDANRIGTFGYSAGGHLAALAGHIADDPKLGDPRTRVRTIVAGGAPTDLTLYEGGQLVPAFVGGPKSERLEAFRAASPVTYVNAGDPPVFIYHATIDGYVPFEQATRYKALLDRTGITNEMFVIRGHGHITAFYADGAAVNAALDFMDRYLR